MLASVKETVEFINKNTEREYRKKMVELFFQQLGERKFVGLPKDRVSFWIKNNVNHWIQRELIHSNVSVISKRVLRLHVHKYAPELNQMEFKNGFLIDVPNCTTISHGVVQIAKEAILKPEILKRVK